MKIINQLRVFILKLQIINAHKNLVFYQFKEVYYKQPNMDYDIGYSYFQIRKSYSDRIEELDKKLIQLKEGKK